MLSPFRNLVRNCRPIRICNDDVTTGSRVGGYAPEGVLPPVLNSLTRYFATVTLDEAHDLSIFLGMDYDEGSPTSLWQNVVKLHSIGSDLVQCVIHGSSARSFEGFLVSELDGHALEIGDERPDISVEPKGPLLIPCKIGGRPYFYYDNRAYMASIDRLFNEGFIYLLQFTCPSAKETPKGEWPFFEFTFHLFAKETAAGIIWSYGWG